jgi:hypothetical protein
VKRLENEPFALIGVNTDPPSTFATEAARAGVTWRNAIDGSPRGPSCSAWSVTRFPTLYVIDARGVIRAADVHFEALDRVVDRLLEERRAAGQRTGGR